MKLKYRAMALFLVIMLLCTGCTDPTAGQIFRCDVPANPTTFDPQLASTQEELMIIENSFEGLLRRNTNGTLEKGVAKDWKVSEDGREYTFYLREDAKWSDGETPVTAKDFEFAFRRLMDPRTGAPSARSFLCLENGEAVLDGKLPPEEIGVEAVNATTLTIRMDHVNPLFGELLASAAAMPCNETFFREQKGKYGVTVKNSIFNGPFAVTTWDPEKYVVLRANEAYVSEKPTVSGGMTLYIQDEPSQTTARLLDGTIDVASLSFGEAEELGEQLQLHQFQDTVWSIRFSPDSPLFQSGSLRRGLAHALNFTDLNASAAQNGQISSGVVPSAVTLSGTSYRQLAAGRLNSVFDEKGALADFRSGLEELKLSRLPKVTLLVPEVSNLPLLAGMLQEQWQSRLSAYINIETLPGEELEARIRSGKYDMAIVPVDAEYNSPAAVLEQFARQEEFWNPSDRERFLALLQEASLSETTEEMTSCYVKAEQMVLDLAPAIPVLFETSYYGLGPDVQDAQLSPFSYRAFFKYARKPQE